MLNVEWETGRMMDFNPRLIETLTRAKTAVFFTGAGVSAESGISTFRGAGGIWNKLKPEELASFDAFMRNPDLVWEWYQYRRQIVHQSQPNAGHLAIAGFEEVFDQVTVVTQNVDNLHSRAGSSRIYELHGNIEKNFCVTCRKRFDSPEMAFTDKVPRCDCGGLIRPDVVWFGELLPEDQFTGAEVCARKCDIMFIAGTSAVVYPAAQIPMVAKEYGATLVEVNLERTEISYRADFTLLGKSGEILPALLNAVKAAKK